MAVFSIGFITALMTIPNWLFLSALKDFRQPGDEERSGYFHIIPGFSLFDHILSIHYTESSLICGLLCLRNEKCASFNFGRTVSSDGKFQCELSGSNATQSPMKLKRRSSFDYFQNFCQDRSLCHSRSPIVSSSVRCPKLEIAVLPYIDDRCNVDTSLIVLNKGERNITEITHASFEPRYQFNFSEAVRVCEILNGSLATLQQMQAAYNKGFQQCSFGWLAGGIIVIPMQELRNHCFDVGLNPSTPNKGRDADAYCVGVY